MRQVDRMIVPSCLGPLNPGKKYISVHLLTHETLYCVVEAKTKVQEVLDEIGNYTGIKDIYLFGLATHTDNEYIFLSQESKLSKCAPKQWKAQNNHGLDGAGRPTVSLYLRIQFYVDCHLLIREKVARYHYYLQLRENVLKYHQRCSDEQYFLLASYAIQADIGNFNVEEHIGQYFVVESFFPSWVIDHLGKDYIVQNMPSMHKDVYGLGRGEAQMSFIGQASYINNPFNIHIYKLLIKKNDAKNFVWLSVSPKGLEIYVNTPSGYMELLTTFLWNDIKKLCFEKKKFEIRVASYPDIRKYTYYATSDEKARYLLHLCKVMHQLIMALKPKIAELKTQQQDGKQIYRESYIYSDNFDLEWEQEHGSLSMSYKDFGTLPKASVGHKDQRISVISNASSNTTSGIVSDRVQSLDGSEDDLDLEVMIDCSAESMESLPAATSHDHQWCPRHRSSLASDFLFDDYKLHPVNETRPVTECANSTAVNRNDSCSSYQTISTIRSCSQKNVATAGFSSDSSSHHLKTSKESRISLSLNALPKMDVLGYFDSTFDQNRHRKDSKCDENGFEAINLGLCSLKDEDEPTVACVERSKVSSAHHNSRILTSISCVPAPVVSPPNINFQLPHNRTKIGVSSLSRATHGGKLSLALADVNSVGDKFKAEPIKNSPISNLPPTPLFNAAVDATSAPQYEPVLLPVELKASQLSSRASPAKTYATQSETCNGVRHSDSIHSSDGELKLDVHDYFIPPPPLYANSTSSFNLDLQDSDCASSPVDESGCSLKLESVDASLWMPLSPPGFAAKTNQERNKLAALKNVSVDLSFEDCNNNIGNDLNTLIIPPPPLSLNQISEDGQANSFENSFLSNSEHESVENPEDSPTLDIATLRKRSKDLDLPLISALCNDQSLITLAKHPCVTSRRTSLDLNNSVTTSLNRPVSWHLGSDISMLLQNPNGSNVINGLCHACNNNSLPFVKASAESKSLTKASSVNCLTKYSIPPTMVALNFDSNPNTFNRTSTGISFA